MGVFHFCRLTISSRVWLGLEGLKLQKTWSTAEVALFLHRIAAKISADSQLQPQAGGAQ